MKKNLPAFLIILILFVSVNIQKADTLNNDRSVGAVAEATAAVDGTTGSANVSGGAGGETVYGTERFAASSVGEVSIDAQNCVIEFFAAKDGSIKVETQSAGKFEISNKYGVLRIISPDSRNTGGRTARLSVYVPQSYAKSVKIGLRTGSLTLYDKFFSSLELNVADANVEVRDFAGKFVAAGENTNVTVRRARLTEDSSIDLKSGNITATVIPDKSGAYRFYTVSGRVTLTLPADTSAFVCVLGFEQQNDFVSDLNSALEIVAGTEKGITSVLKAGDTI